MSEFNLGMLFGIAICITAMCTTFIGLIIIKRQK